ncbi:MAG: hypothetical protein IT236_06225 [Bacteroidia bacterium]|nr:hypothetical protein [Bacteroidia bacterium]
MAAHNLLSQNNPMKPKHYTFILLLLFCSLIAIAQKQSREDLRRFQKNISNSYYWLDSAKAWNSLEEATKIDSGSTYIYALRALLYQRYGNFAKALSNFDLFVKHKPNSPFCIYRGILKSVMGDTAGAWQDMERAISLAGNETEIIRLIFMHYKQATQPGRFEAYFRQVLAQDSGITIAYIALAELAQKKNKLSEAQNYYAGAIHQINQNLFDERYKLKFVYWNKGSVDYALQNYETALENINQTILLFPNQARYYRVRAKLYYELGQQHNVCTDNYKLYQMKEEIFMPKKGYLNCNYREDPPVYSKKWLTSVELEENCLKAYDQTLFDTLGLKTAIGYFNRALNLQPDNLFALSGRANCYMKLADHKNLIKDLEQLLMVNPKCSPALLNLAGAKKESGQLPEALKYINQAITLRPGNAENWLQRAEILFFMQDSEKALKDVTKAIELNPNLGRIYFLRSIINLEAFNKQGEALADIKRAIELEQNWPLTNVIHTYYNNYAMVLNKMGRYHEALVEMDKAIAMNPENAIYYYRCGEIYARLKDMKSACREWTIAKQLGLKTADEAILYNCETNNR